MAEYQRTDEENADAYDRAKYQDRARKIWKHLTPAQRERLLGFSANPGVRDDGDRAALQVLAKRKLLRFDVCTAECYGVGSLTDFGRAVAAAGREDPHG